MPHALMLLSVLLSEPLPQAIPMCGCPEYGEAMEVECPVYTDTDAAEIDVVCELPEEEPLPEECDAY